MHVDLLILHQTEETKKTRKRKKKKKAAEEGGKQIVGGNTPKSVNAYHRKQAIGRKLSHVEATRDNTVEKLDRTSSKKTQTSNHN